MQTNNVHDLFPEQPKPNNALWWIFVIIVIAALLTSCSSSRKIKSFGKKVDDSSSQVKFDSSNIKQTDSSSVKKDNTVTVKETEGAYTKETIFEFADEPKDTLINTGLKSDLRTYTAVQAADYFPPIKTTGHLKKITIKESGTVKQKETRANNTVDSTQFANHESTTLNKDTKTETHKTEVVSNKDVKRTSYWGWLWLGLIAAAIFFCGWYFGWWQMLIILVKSRKKDKKPVLKFDYQLPEKPKENT